MAITNYTLIWILNYGLIFLFFIKDKEKLPAYMIASSILIMANSILLTTFFDSYIAWIVIFVSIIFSMINSLNAFVHMATDLY